MTFDKTHTFYGYDLREAKTLSLGDLNGLTCRLHCKKKRRRKGERKPKKVRRTFTYLLVTLTKSRKTRWLTEFTVAEHVADERKSARSRDLLERLDVRRLDTAQSSWQLRRRQVMIIFFQLELPQVGELVKAERPRTTSQLTIFPPLELGLEETSMMSSDHMDEEQS